MIGRDWLCYCPLLLLLLLFDPGTQFPGNEKITLCNKKVQKSSWNEPYSSSFTPLLLLQFMLKVLFD